MACMLHASRICFLLTGFFLWAVHGHGLQGSSHETSGAKDIGSEGTGWPAAQGLPPGTGVESLQALASRVRSSEVVRQIGGTSSAMRARPPANPRQGTCSCYEQAPKVFSTEWAQGLCVCQVMCLVENIIVHFGSTCVDAPALEPGGALSRVPCKFNWKHRMGIRRVTSELRKHRFKMMPRRWLETRKKIVWKNGTTLFSVLDSSAYNVYHLVSKVMPWTYFNGVMSQGLPNPISRIIIKRSQPLLRAMLAKGEDGEHAVVLQALLNGLFAAPRQAKETNEEGENEAAANEHAGSSSLVWLTRQEVLTTGTRAVGGGRVMFETDGHLARSSWSEPLCLETVVFPGCVRGTLYQEGKEMAQNFKTYIRQALDVPPVEQEEEGSRKVRLLYVQRRPKVKRGFSLEGEAIMDDILKRSGMSYRTAKFEQMAFREQFIAVQWADVIIGVHGANMLNPSLFMRQGAIMMELFPWHFLWRGYGNTTMALGGIYMGYMLDRYDQPMANHTVSECYRNAHCLYLYREKGKMPLSKRDVKTIDGLLATAKRMAEDIVEMRRSSNVPRRLGDEFKTRHLDGRCQVFDRDKKAEWVSFLNEDTKNVDICALSMKDIPMASIRNDRDIN